MQEIGPVISTVAQHTTASVASSPHPKRKKKRKNPKQQDIVFAEQQDSPAQSMQESQ